MSLLQGRYKIKFGLLRLFSKYTTLPFVSFERFYYNFITCGYGIMAIMSPFQGEDEGSIPFTRSEI